MLSNRTYRGAFLLCAVQLVSLALAQDCKPVSTVDNFDIATYVSAPWYVHQQAETQYSPRSQFYCVRAQYSVLSEPTTPWQYTIQVNNRAEDESGQEYGGQLCAYTPSASSSSKLAVAPCFLPKSAAGPYWVVAYNEDEGYALISGGQPTIPTTSNSTSDNSTVLCRTGDGINNSGLWIFSRSSRRDEGLIATVRELAVEAGFDVSVLYDVNQTNCYNDTTTDNTASTTTDTQNACVDTASSDTCSWVGKYRWVLCWFRQDCAQTCGQCQGNE